MDLQAILDSADSSSSESYSGGGKHKIISPSRGMNSESLSNGSYNEGSYNDLNNLSHYGDGGAGSEDAVDLERILREDDDDDDDEDDGIMSNSTGSGGGGTGYAYDRRHRRTERKLEDEGIPRPPKISSSSRRVSSMTASYHSTSNNSTSNISSAEEWDVLQAILGEEDDDGDDHGEYRSHTSSSYLYGYGDDTYGADDPILISSRQGSKGRRHEDVDLIRNQNQVDLILQQSDDEDDLVVDEDLSMSFQQQQKSNYDGYTKQSEYPQNPFNDQDLVDVGNVDSFATAMQSQDSELSDKQKREKEESNYTKYDRKSSREQLPSRKKQSSKKKKSKSTAKLATSDIDLEKASRKALQIARSREAKLLKSTREARDNIVSPLTVKRRLKPKIELDTKSQRQAKEQETKQQEKNQSQSSKITSIAIANSTNANNNSKNSNSGPYFNFSGGVIAMKKMQSTSKSLVERCRSTKGDDNLPTAVGINSRFVAIGTQTGAVLVYDHFEVLRQILGGSKKITDKNDDPTSNAAASGGDTTFDPRTAGAVTTVDLSLVQGEFLAAGYTGGIIVLWDIIRGIPLKCVVDNHAQYPSPIVSVRFFADDLKIVTVDAGGVVNKLAFTKPMLWTTYSVDSDCLLDGTAGQILAVDVLPPYQYIRQQLTQQQQQQQKRSGGSISEGAAKTLRTIMKKLILIALSNERNSFAIAVEPDVRVLHRWAKPSLDRIEGEHQQPSDQAQVFLPCLSWGWALINGGGNVINPILARAWGCCIQFLRASFPEAEFGGTGDDQEGFQYPAFGIHDEFDVDVPIVSLEWLNDRSLVYLSMNNEFTVIDTVMMTLLERIDFSNLKLVYAEFSLSRKVAPPKPATESESDENDVKNTAAATPIEKAETYFCTTFQNSMRSCDKRLLLLCQEELKSVSVVGALPRISGLENDGEWLEALALALDHYENTIKSQEDRRRNRHIDLSKHPGLQSRNSDGRTEDEEWIAKLLIRYLNIAVENAPETNNEFNFPPEIRQAQMDLARSHFQMLAGVCVEFCVVTKRLDLLYGTIFHRFHDAGFLSVFLDVLEPYILNDKLNYIAPEAMMHFVEHCRTNNGIATVERCLLHMDVTIMDFDTILNLLRANEMYSALFYIYNQGLKDFTTPMEILCETIFDAADTLGQLTNERRIDGVPQNNFERFGYKAILYLDSIFRGRHFPKDTEMAEDMVHKVRPQLLRFLLSSRYKPSQSIRKPKQVLGQRALRYPYAHILLTVDPKAMFDTLSTAMDAPDEEFSTNRRSSVEGWELEVGADAGSSSTTSVAPDRQEIISMLLSIMMPSMDDVTITHQTTLYKTESAVNAFLDFLAAYLMRGVVRTNKTVTFMILKRMAKRYAAARDSEDRKTWQGQIIALLSALPRSSYETGDVLALVEKSGIHRASLLLHQAEASAWSHGDMTMERRATHFCAAIDCYLDDDDLEFRKEVFPYVKKECSGATDEKGPNVLRDALITKLVDLVILDALLTAELTADLFVDDPDLVIRSLKDEEARFMFLKAVISGDLSDMDPVAGSVLNAQLTTEHHHHYMALMAKLYPDMVYDYLSTHNNYRTEECLQLCQNYDIADASAYLLERMGNVTSALQLILQTMETRMMNLKRTIRGMSTDYFDKYYSKHRQLTKRDRIHPEVYGKQQKEIDGLKKILTVALDVCERNSGSISSRNLTEHGSQLWFNVLDRLINAKGFLRLTKEQPSHAKIMSGVLSELLRMTMQRMVSSVPLPDLVRKVTSDHSGSRLGEVREMIESLLSTYGQELDVFGGAVSVFHYDSYQMEKTHHGLRVSGSNVQSIMGVGLSKSPNSVRTMARILNDHEVVQLGGSSGSTRGDASVIIANMGSPRHQGSKAERGLDDALSRLRLRRQRGSLGNAETNGLNIHKMRKASGLSLMTSNEMAYRRGELSADATFFEDRQVGQLGAADHRGRIMSFIY
jgi:hypothetical protein